MTECVNKGLSVCVWPLSLKCGKDINEMFLSGLSVRQIQQVIDDNTKTGLEALVGIDQWSKT